MPNNSYTCPFCNTVMSFTLATRSAYCLSFNYPFTEVNYYHSNKMLNPDPETIKVVFYSCPRCGEISTQLEGIGKNYKGKIYKIRPISSAVQFPDYIPLKIRQDYEEACAIVDLSPKSSATLSRRCLQSMIRDFWGINKNRLVDAINELHDKVPPTQWKIIDALRSLGNIGAHPDADINTIIEIEPSDAQKLIDVIELLINQWYVERQKQEELFNQVLNINEDKKEKRKSGS